ncbi:SAM-dependent methyltransferase [Sphaerisporangium krabiense]|uniref:SAM-dependent methyltransferase n=1 Tax=Sphaerisporangium krabiense TaxID=763782 RepID=A0A7W9DUY3_9ACTN|nr:class I SAM-dependent methyltransferase [Sphaerisporangium krabiense]MBB5631554.1 SAM-dependent methyltransferase [Sphaerisporangium krabiense]GII60968.1 SAM-dependent methyltransferase [Sphaerisporangium krabiense]
MTNHTHHHGHAGHGHHHGAAHDDAALAEMLDLDAEILHPMVSEMTAWLADLAGEPAPRRILDLGSGTGSGAFALLRRFDGAEVTAVDASDTMLDRLLRNAREQGLAGRIHAVRADLDEGWPAVGAADLVWASASLHHLADPGRVFGEVLAALRPGGLFAVLEMESFPRILPDDLGVGRPGLEARCHAALKERRRHDMPLMGADWGELLSEAGFAVEARRDLTLTLTTPPPGLAGRYAQVMLDRLRSHLRDDLDAGDLATLDALLETGGPHDVRHRTDLTVRATRPAWVARRP